jgi:hypothetical protein
MPEKFTAKKRQRKKEKQELARARRSNSRPTKRAVLFIVEGETEKLYLQEFFKVHKDYQLIDYTKLRIENPACTDPESLVDYAILEQHRTNKYDDVFCVFDRDEYHIHGAKFQSALQRVQGTEKLSDRRSKSKLILNDSPKLHALYSVPCFELWFLLRFAPTTKLYERAGVNSPADVLIRDLKSQKIFANYDKTNSANFYLIGHNDKEVLKITYENGNKICESAKQCGAEEPYLTFHRLLDYLESDGENFERIVK